MAQDLRFPRINSVMLSGHLTREVELRYTPKGNPIARLGLAFNRSYKNAEGNWVDEAHFIDIKTFGRLAEECSQRLHKGSPIIVEGFINTFTYTNKENQQRKIIEVSANKIHYLEKKYDSQSEDNEAESPDNHHDSRETSNITDDDVPF